jgi:NADP-dependent aldehyde dehydrogenase
MKDITIPGGKRFANAQKMIEVFGLPDAIALNGQVPVAGPADVDHAVHVAVNAFKFYRTTSAAARALFLEAIATEIMALGDLLIQRAHAETALPVARLKAERGRTTSQLRMFAELLREGSWVEAIIDPADPTRQPIQKPDLRRMCIPVGPVAVFGAGNFPLAYSTAGGDTASALAAGCPVIVKAHENHLGTHLMVTDAILRAAEQTGMPQGVFQSLIGDGYATGQELVRHPGIKAAGFTGSQAGGRALFDLACQRSEPIPFFAEMGSVNPVFILPGALSEKAAIIARQIVLSFTLHAGQYCTNPGLVIVQEGEGLAELIQFMQTGVQAHQAEGMYAEGVYDAYHLRSNAALENKAVDLLALGQEGDKPAARSVLAQVSASDFLTNPALHEEIFGPFSLIVRCAPGDEMEQVASALAGQLTTAIWANENEGSTQEHLLKTLREKAGRLIWNGMPTGVEVGPAMVHGGPYPATTDSRFTSVGTTAIHRWTRPICFQNLPDHLVPPELQRSNPMKIWRQIDHNWTKDPF